MNVITTRLVTALATIAAAPAVRPRAICVAAASVWERSTGARFDVGDVASGSLDPLAALRIFEKSGRGGRIRTADPLTPSQVR